MGRVIARSASRDEAIPNAGALSCPRLLRCARNDRERFVSTFGSAEPQTKPAITLTGQLALVLGIPVMHQYPAQLSQSVFQKGQITKDHHGFLLGQNICAALRPGRSDIVRLRRYKQVHRW